MATKLKSKNKHVTVNCSPLKRSRMSVFGHPQQKKRVHFNKRDCLPPMPPPALAGSRSLKSNGGGLKRILGQYEQVEGEMMELRRMYYEMRLKCRMLKKELKEQRQQARMVVVKCALRLHERERELKGLRQERQDDLTKINQDLMYLRANMMKEQKRLETVLSGQAVRIKEQEIELQMLRCRLGEQDRLVSQVETPFSSLDNSPDSSFAIPKFEIRPPLSADQDAKLVLPPPLPPPSQWPSRRRRDRVAPIRGHGFNDAFACLGHHDDAISTDSAVSVDDHCSSWSGQEELHIGVNRAFVTHPDDYISALDTPSVSLTNHREFKKPKDLKQKRNRNKITTKVMDGLEVVEEHELSDSGSVTSVKYWTSEM